MLGRAWHMLRRVMLHVQLEVVDGVQLLLDPTLLHICTGKHVLVHVFCLKVVVTFRGNVHS